MPAKAEPPALDRLLADPRLQLLASALLTLPYWASGVAKLTDPAAAIAEMRHFALEPAALIAGLVVLVQIGGSLLIILGRMAWLGAAALAGFTALATLVAHPFWNVSDPVLRFQERNIFLEHAGLIGGLVLAAIVRRRSPA